MVWVPDIDYPTAQQTVGYPVSVLADGTDTGLGQPAPGGTPFAQGQRRCVSIVFLIFGSHVRYPQRCVAIMRSVLHFP